MDRRVFTNAKWIIGCKVFQSLLQLLVGMLTARYLGPENYGLIRYAGAVTAFALPVMKLGFDATLIRELVERPDREGEILGTALGLNLLSSFGCTAGVFLFVSAANPGERETVLVCLLYSMSLIFGAAEMIQYWFQYRLLSKYSSLAMLGGYGAVSAYKIFLLAAGKSVWWFALSHGVEYGIVAMSLLLVYRRIGGARLRFSFGQAGGMLRRSRYYILAAMMVVVIQNTDHIMITAMTGKGENGLYAAAVTSVGMVQFVFGAIVDSFRPHILSRKKEDQDRYEQAVVGLYRIGFCLLLAQAAAFFLLAKPVIWLLYGKNYLDAVPILRVLAWFFLFSELGRVRNVWILAEEKQKYLGLINLTGALLNVAANALLIPRWGAMGAAAASLLTQAFVNVFLGFLVPALRGNNVLMLRALIPKKKWLRSP